MNLSKKAKTDFADHLAHKMFKSQLQECEEKLIGIAEDVANIYIPAERRRAIVEICPNWLIATRNAIRLQVGVDKSTYANGDICVEVPVSAPIPTEHHYSAEVYWIFTYSGDLFQMSGYLQRESETYQKLKKLGSGVPAEIARVIIAKKQFEKDLLASLESCRTLKQLKKLAPELAEEWESYFGSEVTNLPAIPFVDVLDQYRKLKEVGAEAAA